MTAHIVIDMDGEAFKPGHSGELLFLLCDLADGLAHAANGKVFDAVLHDSDGNPCGKFTVSAKDGDNTLS